MSENRLVMCLLAATHDSTGYDSENPAELPLDGLKN